MVDDAVAVHVRGAGAGQAVGGIAAPAHVEFAQQRAGGDVDQVEHRHVLQAVVAVGRQHRPLAAVQAGDDRARQGMAEACERAGAAFDLPEQLRLLRVGDVQGEERAAAGAEAADQHGAPGAVEEHVFGDQGAVHQVAMLRNGVARIGQPVHAGQGGTGHEGEDLFAGLGVEGVQHAVVGADVDHAAPRGLRRLEFAVGVVPAAQAVIVGAFQAVARQRRAGRRRHQQRRRVDDVAEQPAAHAELAPFEVALAGQVLHACFAAGVLVAGERLVEDAPLPAVEVAPGEVHQALALAHEYPPRVLARVEQRLGAPQLLPAGVRRLQVLDQVAAPVLAGEGGDVDMRLVLHLAGRHRRPRRRGRTVDDAREDAGEGVDHLLRVLGAEELAAGVDRRVPEVVDVVFMIGARWRPGDAAIGQALVAGPLEGAAGPLRAEQRVPQAQAHGESHQVLPGRRVVARVPVLPGGIRLGEGNVGLQLVGKVRARIGGPVVEGQVGQGVLRPVLEGRAGRIVSAVRQRPATTIDVAAHRARPAVPQPIGHHQVIAGATGEFRLFLAAGLEVVGWAVLVGDEFAGPVQRLAQRRTAAEPDARQPVEEIRAVLLGEWTKRVATAVADAVAPPLPVELAAAVQILPGQPDGLGQAVEGQVGGALGGQGAVAVEGVPDGEVLPFVLAVRAGVRADLDQFVALVVGRGRRAAAQARVEPVVVGRHTMLGKVHRGGACEHIVTTGNPPAVEMPIAREPLRALDLQPKAGSEVTIPGLPGGQRSAALEVPFGILRLLEIARRIRRITPGHPVLIGQVDRLASFIEAVTPDPGEIEATALADGVFAHRQSTVAEGDLLRHPVGQLGVVVHRVVAGRLGPTTIGMLTDGIGNVSHVHAAGTVHRQDQVRRHRLAEEQRLLADVQLIGARRHSQPGRCQAEEETGVVAAKAHRFSSVHVAPGEDRLQEHRRAPVIAPGIDVGVVVVGAQLRLVEVAQVQAVAIAGEVGGVLAQRPVEAALAVVSARRWCRRASVGHRTIRN